MKKGQKHSKETKEKMRISHLGKSTWNKGIKMSKEYCQKLSSIRKGKPSHRKGKFLSDETKLKMSISCKERGVIPPNHTGLIRSEETKNKIRMARLGIKRPDISGEKYWNWKGGITELKHSIRESSEYSRWRTKIFKRDGYKCVWGGESHGNELNSDHIKSFSSLLRENNIKTVNEAVSCQELWNIDNGRTLCVPCHQKTDTYGSKSMIKINLPVYN